MNEDEIKKSPGEGPNHRVHPERKRQHRERPRHRPAPPTGSRASVNMDELRDLVQLIVENGLSEFELENEAIRVKFSRGVSSAARESQPESLSPSTQALPAPGPASEPGLTEPVGGASQTQTPAESPAVEDNLYIIPSPILGTFYRAASPNSEPFVRIGSQIFPDTVVCIIEAMKLMNEIQAETTGEIVKIYLENGQAVEYGQPLFAVKRA
jgi:acetyl-CoA carboxylase biotin carboxyl carrier protein